MKKIISVLKSAGIGLIVAVVLCAVIAAFNYSIRLGWWCIAVESLCAISYFIAGMSGGTLKNRWRKTALYLGYIFAVMFGFYCLGMLCAFIFGYSLDDPFEVYISLGVVICYLAVVIWILCHFIYFILAFNYEKGFQKKQWSGVGEYIMIYIIKPVACVAIFVVALWAFVYYWLPLL